MTLDVQTIADQIEEVSHQHGEPYTLLDRRLEALQLMADQKMPTIPRYHFEDWPLLSDQPLAFEDSDPHLAEGLLDSDPDVIRIVQVGQTTTEVQLPEELRQQGVILTDIFSAARIHPRLIERFFMNRVVKPGENKMTAAHLAFLGYNPLKGNKYETQDLLSLGGFLFAKLFDTRSAIFSKLLSGFGSFDQGFR